MNRYQYLETLDKLLQSLPYDQRREIMYDYEEHFKEGLTDGVDEETLIASLGSPEKVAAQYVTVLVPVEKSIEKETPKPEAPKLEAPKPEPRQQTKPQPKGNSSGAKLVIASVLIFINLILLGFYLGIWGTLIGFGAAGIGLFIAGIAVAIFGPMSIPMVSVPLGFTQTPLLCVLLGILILSIGALLMISTYFATRFTCYITGKYVKWNLHLIRGY